MNATEKVGDAAGEAAAETLTASGLGLPEPGPSQINFRPCSKKILIVHFIK